jgi:hypothetical protein
MIRLGVPQLRQPPMAETQRRVLCHCLRVGVVFLLRPLRSTTTTKGRRVGAGARATDGSSKAVLSSASYRWTRTAVAPAPQPGSRKLRFDRWCIWGLSSRMRGVAVLGPLAHARSLPR